MTEISFCVNQPFTMMTAQDSPAEIKLIFTLLRQMSIAGSFSRTVALPSSTNQVKNFSMFSFSCRGNKHRFRTWKEGSWLKKDDKKVSPCIWSRSGLWRCRSADTDCPRASRWITPRGGICRYSSVRMSVTSD